jgi:hypothetical protein
VLPGFTSAASVKTSGRLFGVMAMSEAKEEIPGDGAYHVKTFSWRDSPTAFTVVMIGFDAGKAPAMMDENFSGRGMLFGKLPPVDGFWDYDPYRLDNIRNEGNLLDFLTACKRSWVTEGESSYVWYGMKDGQTISPEIVDDLV